MKHLSFYNKKSCSITGNVIFIYILLSCLAFFTAGCGHSNLYIDGMDKNTAVPALKVPVKFYVKNNIILEPRILFPCFLIGKSQWFCSTFG